MEARALAELPVPRLERLGHSRIGDHRIDAGPNLIHLLEVGQLEIAGQTIGRQVGRRFLAQTDEQVADDVGPAVVHQVFGREPARHKGVEVVHALLLPTRLQRLRPRRIGGPVVAHVDGRRGSLEHVELIGVLTQVRYALNRRRSRSDDSDALTFQSDEATLGRTAGVRVVPTAGVKGVTLERLDTRNTRQLGSMQRPIGHHHETRAHLVTAVGGDDPAADGVVPAHFGHFGLEARVAVEIEVTTDGLAVREDFRCFRVLLLRDVPDFLEKRQIDVRLDVAGRTGIAVPVPGAAEVATLFDHAEVVDAGLTQSGTGQQAAETTTDDGHLNLVEQRLTIDGRDVRVFEVVREVARDHLVLLVAIGAQALVALGPVLVTKLVGVEVGGGHVRSSSSESSSRLWYPY